MEQLHTARERKCRNCGMNVPGDEAVCPFCGARISRRLGIAVAAVCAALLIVFGILAATNPNEKDFEEYVARKVTGQMKGNGADVFQQFAGRAAGLVASKIARRDNYVVFSLFELETAFLRLFRPDFPRVRFLGIGTRIIPLSRFDLSQRSAPSPDRTATPPEETRAGSAGEVSPGAAPPATGAEAQKPPVPQGQTQGQAYGEPQSRDPGQARRMKEAEYKRKMAEHLRRLREAGRNP